MVISGYSKSPIRVESYSQIGSLPPDWDLLLPENHCLKTNLLGVVEESKISNLENNYLMVYEQGFLIGVIYLQHLKISPQHFGGPKLDSAGYSWIKRILSLHFNEIVVCGSAFRTNFPGYYFRKEVSKNKVFEILEAWFSQTQTRCGYCGLVVKDCPEYLVPKNKFKAYNEDVTMALNIASTWNNFDDYQNDLSKKYRQRCKKIRQQGQALERRLLNVEDIEKYSSEIEELYLNVTMKQSVRIGIVNAAYFVEMKKAFGDNFILQGYFNNQNLVAFSSYILYPLGEMEIHLVGMNYKVNSEFGLYFNLLFDGVEFAITNKFKRLELGRTAHTAKASLGAEPAAVNNYLYLRRGMPALAFNILNTWFRNSIGDDWKTRTPFKAALSKGAIPAS